MIETALGVENAFFAASASPRVAGLFLGAEDLTADLRCRRTVKKLTRFIKDWLYLIIAAGAVAALIGADASYWNYTYNDSDGYMRALRVWHWLAAPSFWGGPK